MSKSIKTTAGVNGLPQPGRLEQRAAAAQNPLPEAAMSKSLADGLMRVRGLARQTHLPSPAGPFDLASPSDPQPGVGLRQQDEALSKALAGLDDAVVNLVEALGPVLVDCPQPPDPKFSEPLGVSPLELALLVKERRLAALAGYLDHVRLNRLRL